MPFTGTSEKCVVKGRVAAVEEFRLIFYGDKSDNAVTDEVMWTGYLNTLFTSGWLGHWRNSVSLYAFDVYHWDGNEWQPDGSFTYTKVGTVASGDTLPYQDAAVLLAKTAVKRTFGRKFMPAMLEGDQIDSSWIPTALTFLGTFATAWITAYTSGATVLTPALWTKALVLQPFISAVVDTIVGSQRRRKPGIGI